MLGSRTSADLNQGNLAISANNPAVIDAGFEVINEQFMRRLDAHNTQLQELYSFVEWTDEEQVAYGSYDRLTRTRVDEPGVAPPQKAGKGYFCGLPFEQYQHSFQDTYHYWQQASVLQVARDQLLMMDADARGIIADILNAVMGGTNYDYIPTLYNKGVRVSYTLKVKALANNDGLEYPAGPNGEVFDGTHNHYAAITGFTAAAVSALIENVREHEDNSIVELWIPKGLVSAISAMTPNFQKYELERIVPATTANALLSPRLNVGNTGYREIGEFDGSVVKVRPQMPANYLVAWETNSPIKPVAIHKEPRLGNGKLIPIITGNIDVTYPMMARAFARHHGAGTHNRLGAAVLKVNNSDTTYVAPSLTA